LSDQSTFKFFRKHLNWDGTLLFRGVGPLFHGLEKFEEDFKNLLENGNVERIESFNEIFLEIR